MYTKAIKKTLLAFLDFPKVPDTQLKFWATIFCMILGL